VILVEDRKSFRKICLWNINQAMHQMVFFIPGNPPTVHDFFHLQDMDWISRYKFALLLWLSFLATTICQGQTYSNWVTGDTADISTAHESGLVLAGGGGDNDDAMIWMLNRAAGGDVLIIRASGSDGYNSYFFSQLGVNVNSVETIRFNSAAAANDPYVLRRIREAEVLFLAGGDQYDYYQYWKDSPVEDAINDLINVKQITVGGTSAGMAVLGKVYYAPSGSAVDSSEALSNPYHPDMTVLGRDDFIAHPWMTNTITDTHFDQRTRGGRTVTFMARMETDWNVGAFAIACNEYTAVCVDSSGTARVFGDWPNYSDVAYFMQSNCDQPASLPENCTPGQPLTWDRGNEAIKVYKLPGTPTGANTFALSDWLSGNGGEWEDWYVINGQLTRSGNASPPCPAVNAELAQKSEIRVFPNPVGNSFRIEIPAGMEGATYEISDLSGRMVTQGVLNDITSRVAAGEWKSGVYLLRVLSPAGASYSRLIVRH
jgi:cyanophycinase-like exopeptidase